MNNYNAILSSLSIVAFTVILLSTSFSASFAAEEAWVAEAKKTHAAFKGTKGAFAIFGDSISDTKAYMAPLMYGTPTYGDDKQKVAFETLKGYANMKLFNQKGAKFGNLSRMRVGWANKNMDNWLKQMNPEACIFMFGTNDVKGTSPENFDKELRACMDKLKANGTVCILSSIPPFHGKDDKVKVINEKIYAVAKDYKLLLQDFHKEIITRRPDDWSGKLEKFGQGKNYNVETLIARDGVHPSNPKKYGPKNFTEDGLKGSGFSLRNYLATRDFAQVISKVLKK